MSLARLGLLFLQSKPQINQKSRHLHPQKVIFKSIQVHEVLAKRAN